LSAFPVIPGPAFAPLDITLIAGGPAVRLIVLQNWSLVGPPPNILQFPEEVEWTLDAVLQPVSITADSAGFNFSAPVGMPPTVSAANAVATNLSTGAQGTVRVTVNAAPLAFMLAPILFNDGGVLGVLNFLAQYPISAVGLAPGSVWSNGGDIGVVSIVPGATPNPYALPVYYGYVTAPLLLQMGAGNLPLANPGTGSGQLWNNGGTIAVA
jgi:hypothetical protein